MNNHSFIAKTFAGMEPLLAEELASIGASHIKTLNRSVYFEGGMDVLYRANYYCRTALRILWRVKMFQFQNNDQFYQEIYQFEADRYLNPNESLAFSAQIHNSIFKTPLFSSMLAKDAVCDRFRDHYNERPDVDKENPHVLFHLHIFNNECHLFLDSSVESLHKRGYRMGYHPAPINEVVAAGMIMLSGWKGETDLIDFMCGSGTILMEAAVIALRIPAGFYRNQWGFMRWKNFDPQLWKKVKEEEQILEDVKIELYGSDISADSIRVAKNQSREAGLGDFIHFKVSNLTDTRPTRKPAMVIINPPYGERLKSDNLLSLYKQIGDTLKQQYTGCKAFIISSDLEAMKNIELKTTARHQLYNGALECKYWGYDLYDGTKKGGKEHHSPKKEK